MRTKLRILTVVLLITISVYAGIVFSEHSRNADRVYDDFYAETNFADLMATSYDIEHKDNLTSACASIEYEACEASLILTGQSKTDVDWIASKFYGIEEGDVNKLWAVEGSVNHRLEKLSSMHTLHFMMKSTWRLGIQSTSSLAKVESRPLLSSVLPIVR